MPDKPWILGREGKLYYGVAESNPTTELKNVRNLSMKLTASDVDVTTRDNDGWRATATGLRECSLDFEIVWKPDDPAFEAIRDAYLTNDRIALKILDKVGGQGPWGDFTISGFDCNQDLEEAIKVSVTAKLAVFHGWVEPT